MIGKGLIIGSMILAAPMSFGGVGELLPFEIGFGVRGLSCGGAFSSLIDDSTAAFWNPAALPWMERSEIRAEGKALALGSSLFSGSIGLLLKKAAVGAGFVWYGSGKGTMVDSSGEDIGVFSESKAAAAVGFGYKLGPASIGVGSFSLSAKISGTGFEEKGNGLGLLLGVIFNPIPPFKLGLSFRSRLKLNWSDGVNDESPPVLKIGVSYESEEEESLFRFGIELVKAKGLPLRSSFGLEMMSERGTDKLFIRGGISDVYLKGMGNVGPGELTRLTVKPSLGLGLKKELLNGDVLMIDYAIRLEPLGTRHLISVCYGF